MVYEFKFPDVGEGIHEGKIVKWLAKEGDEIKADQPVVEVETDKAVVELPSPQTGTILKRYFKEGDIVHVGQVAYAIGEKGEQAREIVNEPAAPKMQAPVAPAQVQAPVASAPGVYAPAASVQAPPAFASGGKALATPATRKYAADMGVDIEKVQGTGPGGRVTIEDVKAHASGGAPLTPSADAALKSMPASGQDYGPVERVKMSGLRRAIAEKMVKSVQTIPHVTHMEEVDVSMLAQVRESAKGDALAKGVKLTYLPFIIKAVVGALKEFPQFNARYDEGAQEIVMRKYYNIGIATDTDDGLLVPVIHEADGKDIMTLAMEITTLAEEARKRRLKLADMQGGTFTITNIGSTGGDWATPIINYPEVAILGVMKMKPKPVVVEGNVVSRKIMNLVLSFDHRVIDGAVAARFMNAIAKRLEDPALL
jgi:pyruvate dehydrogenase E2 component (dihydrolipoamide acetyltransferase)